MPTLYGCGDDDVVGVSASGGNDMSGTETGDESGTTGGMETGSESMSGGDGDPTTGDGDGDPTTGDGDGDPTTTGDGDGDPTTTGDGDGDPTTTGDGDGDPTTTGDGDGDPTTTGDGDGDPTTTGDGDGDPTTTGDGDGDPTTAGDGDGDPTTGDGDGDPTAGDGDGDGDVCGDGAITGTETCDGTELNGETCMSQGFFGGTLACNTTCDGFDTTNCTTSPGCGDDNVMGQEVCDGTDLDGEDCASLGFDTGTLACLPGCAAFDTSDCDYTCGNDSADGPEVCDGTDLDGQDCTDLGFTGGTLACATTCDAFDTTACTGGPTCGDGTVDAPEVCDGTEFGGQDCTDFGFDDGTLACNTTCDAIDTTGCNYTCGNDSADGTEVCDGTDLNGQDCTDLGFSGGTLGCATDCTDYDTSACTNMMNNISSFKLTSIAVREPHFFLSLADFFFSCPGCTDITDDPVSCSTIFGTFGTDAVNVLLGDQICGDENTDNLYDLSTILHFTNLDPLTGGASATLQIEENAACAFDGGCALTDCAPGSDPAPSTTWETDLVGSSCLTVNTAFIGEDNNGTPYAPAADEPAAACYFMPNTIPALTIPFGTTPLTLRDARASATYTPQGDANPTGLVTGLIEGFLTQQDAIGIVVADDPAVVTLDQLLPGGTDSCAPGDGRDDNNGVTGWWFYVNFEASAVNYTGTVP